MDSQRFRQIEECFRGAAEVDAAERAAWLDRHCADDPELRAEVEALLAADARDDRAIGRAIHAAAHHVAEENAEPELERVGPYRLERELGRGGMGRVYLGVRDDDAFTKQVAIKLLTHSRLRSDLVQRFRTERQILATLEHPNIARLLDGGTAASGEPYVVMEYVDGRSLLRYCDEERLSLRRRLELFCQICGAVQYAHDHAVVHRDLKPGNVLIGRTGEPKLLDFGIAKLLEPGETVTAETATSMRLMTPQYASPEQVRGAPVTPRTDVYALGVMLYELLTGRPPYRVDAADLTAVAAAVCEQEPMRPSRAVADSAVDSSAGRLRRTLAGDLDNIVLTALRKEPERRYASAAEFAADLRRYLERRPVLARRAAPGYRLGKFVRRKPALTALFLCLALLAATLGLLGVGAARRAQALEQATIAALLDETRWLQERRRDAEAALKAEAVLRLAPGQPQALRYRALAHLHLGLRRPAGAERERLAQIALDDAARLVAALPDSAWPRWLQAYVFERLGRDEERARAVSAAESLGQSGADGDDLDFRAELALARQDYAAAEQLLDELIALHPERARAIASRAYTHEMLGRPERALLDYRVAIGIDPSQDLSLIDLARLTIARGEYDEAERYLARSLAQRPDGAFAHETRGYLLLQRGLDCLGRGENDEALRLFAESEQASRRGLELDPALQWAEINLATSLVSRHRLGATDDPTLLAGVVVSYARVLARWPDPPGSLEERELFYAALSNSCDALIQLDRLEQARETCSRVTRLFPDKAVGFYNLAGVYALLGRPEEALAALEQDELLGDADWEYLQRDAWFASLRGRPEFEALLQRMRARADG